MAGESPGKVERDESSGETAEGDGVVASTGGKESAKEAEGGAEPGRSRPLKSESAGESSDDDGAVTGADDAVGSGGEGDGHGDERLKAAVAAWVAGTGDEPDGEAGSDGETDDVVDAERGNSEGEESKISQSPASDLPVRPKSGTDEDPEGGAAAVTAAATAPAEPSETAPEKTATASTSDEERESGADQPTAMFRAVRPDSGAAQDASDHDAAARRTERMTAAFFGSGKSGGSGDSGASAGEADERGAEETEVESDAESGGVPDAERDEPRVDQPTAAFRAPGPGKPAEKSKDAVDQPTAVFRTVEPEKAEADEDEVEGDEAKAAEPTSELTQDVAKPQPEADSGADADSESESERTSQFVPLQSADAPPRPTRKPGPIVPPKPLGKPLPQAQPQPKPESSPKAKTKANAKTKAKANAPADDAPPQLTEAELSRQQARPDQAPLDLLAQLTNTPPRPETPLRTAVRRVKIWTPLVLLLAIIFVVAQAVRPLPAPGLSLTAASTYTFHGAKPSVPWPSEGQAVLDVQGLGSFGSSGKQKPVPVASVAKVMTAYVILRDHPVKKGSDGPKITVDKKAEREAGLSAQNESTVDVKQGDKISEREAIQAIMIASANNVARLLARWDAGSEKAFAKKMNAAAGDLGMKDTKYTDPSGLTASTVSTATDQVKLAKKAMDMDLFSKTVRLPTYTDTKGDQHGNWNKLVPLDGVVGIKTGTTTRAGGNLIFAAEKNIGSTKQLIIGAVLGQYQPSILDTVLAKSKRLIDTAQNALRAQKVVRKGDVVGYVDDQLGGSTPVVASKDVTAVGWSGLKVKLALKDSGKAIPHKGAAGDKVGTLTVGDGPGQVKVPVALQDDMTEPGFGAKLTRIT